jgi:hypothetical protein
MKKARSSFLAFLTYLMAAGNIAAHVQLDYPIGGETFVAGETINIQWHILISHNQENWDLYFSPNGGENWEIIQLDLNPSRLYYRWTVPQITTENAQIRINMDNTNVDYDDISGDFFIQDTLTSVEERGGNPGSFALHANYPNPFNPTTTISYELLVTGNIELRIFNQLGQEVRTLVNERQHPNYYRIQWDGRDNAGKQMVSGIYVYRLQADSFSRSRKMVLIK